MCLFRMKNTQKYLNKDIKEQYFVPSKSQSEVVYTVRIYSDGRMDCDCVAGKFKAECSHQKIVKLKKDGISNQILRL